MPGYLAVLPGWLRQLVLVGIGVIVFAVFFAAARWLRDTAGKWLVRHHVSGDALVLGRRVVYVTLLIFGALLALTFALGSGNAALAGLVLATVVASFGIQDVMKNYVSGYYVLLERHIRVGDRISVGAGTGTVEDIRLRVTLLRSEGGELIVVPNNTLFNEVVRVSVPVPPKSLGERSEDHPAEGVEAGRVEV